MLPRSLCLLEKNAKEKMKEEPAIFFLKGEPKYISNMCEDECSLCVYKYRSGK